jgi:hypothetical protein
VQDWSENRLVGGWNFYIFRKKWLKLKGAGVFSHIFNVQMFSHSSAWGYLLGYQADCSWRQRQSSGAVA